MTEETCSTLPISPVGYMVFTRVAQASGVMLEDSFFSISVSVPAGQTALTRIPCEAYSMAATLVSPFSACLEAA